MPFFLYIGESTSPSSCIRSLLTLGRIGLPSPLLSHPEVAAFALCSGALGTHQGHCERAHHACTLTSALRTWSRIDPTLSSC